MKIDDPRHDLRAFIILVLLTAGMLLALFAGCSSPTEPRAEAATDTVYVYPQTWVGIEITWAGEPLNNDVQVKRAAGWTCGQPLLEFPMWLPSDPSYTNWFLTMANFYICYAPLPGLAPWRVDAMPLSELRANLEEAGV